jgi:hypothetical protein
MLARIYDRFYGELAVDDKKRSASSGKIPEKTTRPR